MTSFFPPAYKRPEAKTQVLEWVATLPIDPLDKKTLILDWSSLTGVYITQEEIRAAIPELAAEEHPPPTSP